MIEWQKKAYKILTQFKIGVFKMNAVVADNSFIELYEKHIQKLDVPEERKKGTPLNARWFIRNGYVLNRTNPAADYVLDAARKIA